MRPYSLVIFDLDDTLFDYEKTERFAVSSACSILEVASCENLYSLYRAANDVTRRDFREITPANIQAFRLARAKAFLDSTNRPELAPEDFVTEYLRHSTVGILMPGVPETLELLAAVPKVVATNGTEYPRRNKFEGSAIASWFDGFFSAESLGAAKPDPEFFLRILQLRGLKAQDVLIVGDSYRLDVMPAVALGIDCCWFDHHGESRETRVPQGVSLIGQFDELVAVAGERIP